MSMLLASNHVRFVAGFVPTHADLYRQLLTTTEWDDRIRARKTASFGMPYNYSGIAYPTIAFPAHLLPTVDQLEQHLGYRSNNCLANFYPDGTSTMGFHSDSTTELEPGTGIAIVSLGAERTLTFRHQADRTQLEPFRLSSGSLLFMSAMMQNEWKHAILPEEGAGPRISLTFRRLRL
ncbi:2OG-Fe(II) oxygenase [Limnoglobus roseus]|uniref:2OG-Fe(II) oxygenase n=2 Tax=Limnoglobus roseus TaxID=2598579 RepID=A0A5C1AEX5_9BACT|nr:2OG-Fe(II) oxygenase [Limnoglobus roseus]